MVSGPNTTHHLPLTTHRFCQTFRCGVVASQVPSDFRYERRRVIFGTIAVWPFSSFTSFRNTAPLTRPKRKAVSGGFADGVASCTLAGRGAFDDVGDGFAIKEKRKEIKHFSRVHVDPRGCGEAALLQPAAGPRSSERAAGDPAGLRAPSFSRMK